MARPRRPRRRRPRRLPPRAGGAAPARARRGRRRLGAQQESGSATRRCESGGRTTRRGRRSAPPSDRAAACRRAPGGAPLRARRRRAQRRRAARRCARSGGRGRDGRPGSERVSARVEVERADVDFRAGDLAPHELFETAHGSIECSQRRAMTVPSAVPGSLSPTFMSGRAATRDAAEAARAASKSYARAAFSPALIASSAHVQPGLRADACAGRDRRMRRAARCRTGPVERGERELVARRRSPHSKAGSRTPAHCVTTRAPVYEDIGEHPRPQWGLAHESAARRAAGRAISTPPPQSLEPRRGTSSSTATRAYASTWAARLAELLYWSGQYEEPHDGRSSSRAREQSLTTSTSSSSGARRRRSSQPGTAGRRKLTA